MKAILINPYPYYARGVEGIVYPPLGLIYLASVAKNRNLGDMRVLDANIMKLENKGVIAQILDYNPDIIGISSNIVTHRSALELAKLIRLNGMKQLLLVGGPYPVLFPDKYLEYCDIIVNGEGEETFCDILEACRYKKEIFSLKGILYKKDNSIFHNKNREFMDNLDDIPFPDYTLLKPSIDYYSKRARIIKNIMAPVMTSRGCPYQCTYCNKSVFGSTFRCRTPENILMEIEWLHKNFKVDQIDILDDNFNLIPERAEKLLDKIIDTDLNIAISCHNGLRADKISDSFAEKLKKSGVFKVGLGIETADFKLMQTIKKNLDLNKVKDAITALRKQRITVHGYFIFGLPGDTPSSMKRTIEFAKDVNPHFCNFATCIPFPGTEVYNIVRKEGTFLEDVDNGVSSGFFDGKVFFEINGTKAKDVSYYCKKAYKDFYFNAEKILDIAFTIKNFRELKWVLSTSLSLVKNMLFSLGKKQS
ncbi:MAG: radical SAM protein [Candidatus Omnitrophota bacterium]|nr:radical SAM protein [Candidatus Omnitrophota bacterium]